jgi:anaerobic magnesium-protoporphyrin IX monomethyl ester cyclase
MADILLTHGFFLFEDEKELRIMKPYPPLGLLYLSSYLSRAGFQVEVFDSTFRSRDELSARLAKTPGGVLGIYTNLLTRPSVIRIIQVARAHGWRIVVGGPESANYPHEYLARGADVIVVGEGEETLAELLPAMLRGVTQPRDVRGVLFRDSSGRVVPLQPRPQIACLDSLPWPDRRQIDCQRYVDVWRERHGAGSLNLITSRGCPYTCRWCSHAVFGFTHRRRNYLDCADELQFLVDTYHPDQVWYADDVFTISHRWLYHYAAELRRRDLIVPFETISRADRMLKESVLETLAQMGCVRVWIGSESGSQRILDAMQRGVTVEQVQWAVQAAKRHGIQVGMFFMWGYPGETFEDIERTVEHLRICNPDVYLTTVAYPIKNTDYFDDVAAGVRLDRAWEEASDRDHVVRGQRPRAYYRLADGWMANAWSAARAADAASAVGFRQEAERARVALLQPGWEMEPVA